MESWAANPYDKHSTAPLRILVADDQPHVRSALLLLLLHESAHTIVGEAHNSHEAVEFARQQQPHVILLDWELPGGPSRITISKLKTHAPQSKIIVLSGRPQARTEALQAGVDAFVSKGDPPEELLKALRNTYAAVSM